MTTTWSVKLFSVSHPAFETEFNKREILHQECQDDRCLIYRQMRFLEQHKCLKMEYLEELMAIFVFERNKCAEYQKLINWYVKELENFNQNSVYDNAIKHIETIKTNIKTGHLWFIENELQLLCACYNTLTPKTLD